MLRGNAFVVEKTRRRYLRVSPEAEQTVIHRLRDLLTPGLAQFAAERAAERGSETVQFVDVQDSSDIRGRGLRARPSFLRVVKVPSSEDIERAVDLARATKGHASPISDADFRQILREVFPEEDGMTQALGLVKMPCPMNGCGHLLEDHERRDKDLVCERCPCNVRANTAFGILIAEMQERGEVIRAPERPREPPPRLPDDLFAPIVGFDDIKEILIRSLTSEKPVHQLLWGPPASAKTLFLLELERVGDARYTLGSTSTKAGLRQLLMDDEPRILLLDELDKGRGQDYSVLLSAMETGILVDTRYGRHNRRVVLDLRVFASANSKEPIWPELRSRFGEGLKIQPYTTPEFLAVAKSVLVMRENVPEATAAAIADAVLRELNSRDVRDAIRVSRLVQNVEDIKGVVEILRRRR